MICSKQLTYAQALDCSSFGSQDPNLIEVPKDGNCLFSSISEAANNPKYSAATLRKAVHEREAQDENLRAFFVNDQEYMQHLKDIEQPGKWGGEHEIATAAVLVARRILVWQDGRPLRVYGDAEHPIIHIRYTGRNHYDAYRTTPWRLSKTADDQVVLGDSSTDQTTPLMASDDGQIESNRLRHASHLCSDGTVTGAPADLSAHGAAEDDYPSSIRKDAITDDNNDDLENSMNLQHPNNTVVRVRSRRTKGRPKKIVDMSPWLRKTLKTKDLNGEFPSSRPSPSASTTLPNTNYSGRDEPEQRQQPNLDDGNEPEQGPQPSLDDGKNTEKGLQQSLDGRDEQGQGPQPSPDWENVRRKRVQPILNDGEDSEEGLRLSSHAGNKLEHTPPQSCDGEDEPKQTTQQIVDDGIITDETKDLPRYRTGKFGDASVTKNQTAPSNIRGMPVPSTVPDLLTMVTVVGNEGGRSSEGLPEQLTYAQIVNYSSFGPQDQNLIEVPKDGNCLFSSISEAANNPKYSAATLRKAVHEREAQDENLRAFFVNDQEYMQHLKDIEQPGKWGGEHEIATAAVLVARRILVWQDGRPLRVYGDAEHPIIHIRYTGRNHYDAYRTTPWRLSKTADDQVVLGDSSTDQTTPLMASDDGQIESNRLRHASHLCSDGTVTGAPADLSAHGAAEDDYPSSIRKDAITDDNNDDLENSMNLQHPNNTVVRVRSRRTKGRPKKIVDMSPWLRKTLKTKDLNGEFPSSRPSPSASTTLPNTNYSGRDEPEQRQQPNLDDGNEPEQGPQPSLDDGKNTEKGLQQSLPGGFEKEQGPQPRFEGRDEPGQYSQTKLHASAASSKSKDLKRNCPLKDSDVSASKKTTDDVHPMLLRSAAPDHNGTASATVGGRRSRGRPNAATVTWLRRKNVNTQDPADDRVHTSKSASAAASVHDADLAMRGTMETVTPIENERFVLTRALLDQHIKHCSHDVLIESIQTDLVSTTNDGLDGPWPYKRDKNVLITYRIEKSGEKRQISWEHLCREGFCELPYREGIMFRFFFVVTIQGYHQKSWPHCCYSPWQ